MTRHDLTAAASADWYLGPSYLDHPWTLQVILVKLRSRHPSQPSVNRSLLGTSWVSCGLLGRLRVSWGFLTETDIEAESAKNQTGVDQESFQNRPRIVP